MARWAIYETATGRLLSDTTVNPGTPRAGLTAASVPDSDEGLMWDATTRAYIARPPKVLIDNPLRDRFQRFRTDSRFTGLNAGTRTTVLALLSTHFADVRFS